MRLSDCGQRVSLTGLWHGQFTYPRAVPPELFTATLQERPDWLSGSTQERCRFGWSAGETLYATIMGRRDGHDIVFTKTYDAGPRQYRVVYVGRLSPDGCEIEGTWSVPGSWSGTFLMIRDPEAAQAARRVAAEQI